MTRKTWDGLVTERDKKVYALGGFAKRGAVGDRLGVLVVDVLYSSMGDRPEPILDSVKKYPASCGEAGWRALGNIKALLTAARSAGLPVIYVVPVERGQLSDYGRYLDKMPAITKVMRIGGHASTDIVSDVGPEPGDRIVRKPKSSGFFKTDLRHVLDELSVDTVIVTGCTTSGCIRLTVADAFQHDLHAVVVEECVYDRGEASHAVNLWDMDAKYADVIPLAQALELFRTVSARGIRERPGLRPRS